MALMPKRVKYRKSQRGRIKGNACRGNTLSFGEYGLQSLDAGYIPAKTIEACRVAANQYIRGEGKLYIRIFPQKSVTARALETRMGTGKGDVDHWVAVVKPGTILFEIAGANFEVVRDTFARVSHKLPINCRLVTRQVGQ
jgi:large subunit ribosomal protein L16